MWEYLFSLFAYPMAGAMAVFSGPPSPCAEYCQVLSTTMRHRARPLNRLNQYVHCLPVSPVDNYQRIASSHSAPLAHHPLVLWLSRLAQLSMFSPPISTRARRHGTPPSRTAGERLSGRLWLDLISFYACTIQALALAGIQPWPCQTMSARDCRILSISRSITTMPAPPPRDLVRPTSDDYTQDAYRILSPPPAGFVLLPGSPWPCGDGHHRRCRPTSVGLSAQS